MTTATRSGATRDLAAWIVDFRWADVPAPVQQRVLDITVDGVAAGLFGSLLPWSVKAVQGLGRLEGVGATGGASVWGHGRRMGAEHAAMLDSSFIQGFELDDYHEFGPLHIASIVVPAVLAWAETAEERPAAEDVLAGLAVGMEIGPRLGIAIGAYDLLGRGWHCGVIYGSLASAAALARLARLDAERTEEALGMAATQASGLMSAQFEGDVKRLQHGFAVRAGLVATALASTGYRGIKDVLEREYGGFSAVFAPGRDIDWRGMVERLGEGWEIQRYALKPYSCYGGLHPAIDAVRAWLADGTLTPATLDRLVVTLPHTLYKHAGWTLARDDWTVIGAQMNLAYTLAATIVTGDAFVDAFLPERSRDDAVWDLVERIEPREDDAWEARITERRTMRATKLELIDTAGRRHEAIIEQATGTTARPLDAAAVRDKARRLLGYVTASPAEADGIIAALDALPAGGDLGAVLDALAVDRTGFAGRFGF